MVFCLGGEEESRRHHLFWVIGHGRIRKIETLQVLYCRSLHIASTGKISLAKTLPPIRYLYVGRKFTMICKIHGFDTVEAH